MICSSNSTFGEKKLVLETLVQMSTTYMAAGITIVLALNSMSEAMRLREYRRPVCSPEQSCFYEAFGMVFALCDCPGEDRSCPQEEEHSIEHRGTMYSFCEARDIPLCKDGDISTSVKGIQTAVHCICPDQNELVQMPGEQKDRTNYVCRQPYHGIDDIVELKTTTVQQFSAGSKRVFRVFHNC
ncbi:unnamed protein product [Nippostrongylus brasiliensis]|uniref:Sortilin_C domain-containing protein n=1 Tax=Nippostrongylus brasiliensis TaxID=27835 RepID=A0A0N4Y056_NIPBR|nr:unnamed protein product [Nippostrongylus brasiliensis]